MDMFRLFRRNRDKVQLKIDEIIMDGMTKDEMYKNRQEIMSEFDGLLENIQFYHNELNSLREDMQEQTELLKQLCKKGES
jgi:hypothetical protein